MPSTRCSLCKNARAILEKTHLGSGNLLDSKLGKFFRVESGNLSGSMFSNMIFHLPGVSRTQLNLSRKNQTMQNRDGKLAILTIISGEPAADDSARPRPCTPFFHPPSCSNLHTTPKSKFVGSSGEDSVH